MLPFREVLENERNLTRPIREQAEAFERRSQEFLNSLLPHDIGEEDDDDEEDDDYEGLLSPVF